MTFLNKKLDGYNRVYTSIKIDDSNYPFHFVDLLPGDLESDFWQKASYHFDFKFIPIPGISDFDDACDPSDYSSLLKSILDNAYRNALLSVGSKPKDIRVIDNVTEFQSQKSSFFINRSDEILLVCSNEKQLSPLISQDRGDDYAAILTNSLIILPENIFFCNGDFSIIRLKDIEPGDRDRIYSAFVETLTSLVYITFIAADERGKKQLKLQYQSYDSALKVLEDFLPRHNLALSHEDQDKAIEFKNVYYVAGLIIRAESKFSRLYTSVSFDGCVTEYDALIKLLSISGVPYRESTPPENFNDDRSYIFIDESQNVYACSRSKNGYRILNQSSIINVIDGTPHPSGHIITIYPTAPEKISARDFFFIGLRNAWQPFLLVLLTATILAGATLIPAYIVQNLTSLYIPYGDRYSLLFFGVSAIGVLALTYVIQIIQGRYLVRFETITDSNMQTMMVDRLLRIKPDYINTFTPGSLQSRVLGISQLRQTITSNLTPILTAFLSVVFNFIYLFFFSWQLSLLVLAAALLLGTSTYFAAVSRLKYFKSLTEIDGLMLQSTNDTINGIQELRIYNTADGIFKNFSGVIKPLIVAIFNATRLNDRVDVLSGATTYILYIFLFPLAYWLVTSDSSSLSIGSIIAFLTCTQTFLSNFQSAINSSITSFVQVSTYWQRATDVIDLPSEKSSINRTPQSFDGSLSVHNLGYKYPMSTSKANQISIKDNTLFQNISFSVEPGKSFLVVGKTCSGKSTLVDLLCGMHEGYAGSIVVSGENLSDISPRVYRNYISHIPQELLFHQGSLEMNITNGMNVDYNLIDELLTRFYLKDYINNLPMKLATVVSPAASSIPIEVKKKIMLIKSAIKCSKYIFMDDTLSGINESEVKLILDFYRSKGSTVISTSLDQRLVKLFDSYISLD